MQCCVYIHLPSPQHLWRQMREGRYPQQARRRREPGTQSRRSNGRGVRSQGHRYLQAWEGWSTALVCHVICTSTFPLTHLSPPTSYTSSLAHASLKLVWILYSSHTRDPIHCVTTVKTNRSSTTTNIIFPRWAASAPSLACLVRPRVWADGCLLHPRELGKSDKDGIIPSKVSRPMRYVGLMWSLFLIGLSGIRQGKILGKNGYLKETRVTMR